jgi:multiple sugar transport system permease protein/sn-glycerol 3-phosphate transport system permease protein
MESTSGTLETSAYQGMQYETAKLSWRDQMASKEWVIFLLFVAPNLFFLMLFTYWPLWENIRLSVQKTDLLAFTGTNEFVGLENFEYIFGNRTFRLVLRNTLVFLVASVSLTMLTGLLISLLLNQKLKARTAVRAIVFAPTLLSGAAIGIVWAYIFDPRYGLLAQVLDWFWISSPHWLDRPEWSLWAIIIVYVWKNLGFAAVIFLAGLQAIPQDLYDAAKIDGANAWWRFKSVTLPMLSPISFFLFITSILATFQAFDIIQVMTEGGPASGSTTLVYYVYEQGFGDRQNFGRSAAAAIVLFIAMLIVTIVQLRFTEKKVHYDG